MLYAGGGLNFQDPISGWFVQGHLSWTRSSSFENTRYFAGEYIVTQRSDNRVPYSGLNTSLLIEKSFLEIAGKVYAKGGYNIFNTSLRQNGDLTAYTGNGANAEAGFAGDVSGWMKIDYTGKFGWQRYTVDGSPSGSTSRTLRQDLALTFFPIPKLELKLAGEHFLSRFGDEETQQAVFLDAAARYAVSTRMDVFLNASNLLNRKSYAYSVVSPLCISEYAYRLRPLNVLLGFSIRF